MITRLSVAQALEKVGRSVLLPDPTGGESPSDALLAQLVRRAITFMSPCAPHEIIRAICLSFSGLPVDRDLLRGRIETVLEDLIVYGDILEMRTKGADGWSGTGAFALRPAPPAFVKRKDGSFAIVGIAGEDITPLTAELDSHVAHNGVLRIITPIENENLESVLMELGLFRLLERTWLRLPTFETPESHVASWRQMLAAEPVSTSIENLHILDIAQSPLFYSGRWTIPRPSHSGMYVARRPQRYGAPLWCIVELQGGTLRRFKDLSVRGDRLRPFDLAWRIQAALDANAGNPQRFESKERDSLDTWLRFYSPVPSWCERYLSIAGRKERAERCLLCFRVPTARLAEETKFLSDALWMTERA